MEFPCIYIQVIRKKHAELWVSLSPGHLDERVDRVRQAHQEAHTHACLQSMKSTLLAAGHLALSHLWRTNALEDMDTKPQNQLPEII